MDTVSLTAAAAGNPGSGDVAPLFCFHTTETLRATHELRIKQDEIQRLATIAERERIARDRYDLLGHTLSLTILKFNLARKVIGKEEAAAVKELENIESISRGALAQVRETIQGYRKASSSLQPLPVPDI